MAGLSTVQRSMRGAVGVLATLSALGGDFAYAADEGLPDRAGLMAALRADRFVELDTELVRIEDAVEAHKLPERNLDYAFHSFANSDPTLEPHLDAWIAASPRSFAAYFARGRYLLHLADLAKDSAMGAEVPSDWRTMIQELRARAARDIGTALELEPSLTWAYSDLAGIADDRGDRISVERLYQQGLAQFPDSGVIEAISFRAMDTSTPAGMRSLFSMVDDLLAKHGDDPNFLYLRGYKDSLLAKQVCAAGNHQKGIELATRAVRATNLPSHVYARAGIYRCAGRLRDAIADYDTVLERTPDFAPAFYWRGKAKSTLLQDEAALPDYDQAVALDPLNPQFLTSRAWTLIGLNRIDEAQVDFEKALIYGKYDVTVLDGLAYLVGNNRHDYSKAAEIYRQASMAQPWRSRWFYNYGFSLMMDNDCRAIEALDSYMAACEAGADCGPEDEGWAPHPPATLRLLLKHLRDSNACSKRPSGP